MARWHLLQADIYLMTGRLAQKIYRKLSLTE